MEERKSILNFFTNFMKHGGAGVVAAAVIILIFLICATWLKSLVYGILLALVLLPLERFFQEKIFRNEKKGWFSRFRDRIREKNLSPEEEQKLLKQKCIFKSSLAAMLTFFAFLILLFCLSCMVLLPHAKSLRNSLVTWGKNSPVVSKVERYLAESEKKKECTVQQGAKEEKGKTEKSGSFSTLRRDLKILAGEKKDILSSFAIARNQDVITTVFGILKKLGTFLLDIALAVFFGFYFLQKIALFEGHKRDRCSQTGEWFVNLFYNSPWLPDVSEETKKQATRIITHINGILSRWVRGYFIVILIEFFLYTILFAAAGVPYFLLASSVAGLSILLPFIGPVVSFSLTVGLCIAFCDTALFMTLIIVCLIYLIINGILEQFFLYPVFIGQVSGLTTVETIIVVLIGGIVAGISGMIFAVPAAAVIKYIIPVIYRASSSQSGQEKTE